MEEKRTRAPAGKLRLKTPVSVASALPTLLQNDMPLLQKREIQKKAYEDRGKVVYEEALEDPVEEKLRLARCEARSLLQTCYTSRAATDQFDYISHHRKEDMRCHLM